MRPSLFRRPPFAMWTLLTLAALAACDEAVRLIEAPPEPPAPTTLQVVSGDGQRTVQGLSLLDPIVVRVLDQHGEAMAGQSVTFAPDVGHGTADPASATTDSDGRAATTWTLGPESGNQTLALTAVEATASATAVSLDLEAELDTLFMPATDAEMGAVRADWAARDVSAVGARVELEEPLDLVGTPTRLRIVSHTVGGSRHYGAIIVPDGAEERSLPILAYLHGGENGVSIGDIIIAAIALGDLRNRFVYVIPSFRSEPLEYGDSTWVSDGPSSHWNYDVDDALALLNVAIETIPEARPDSINLFGGSRGGGDALLAGVRDERIARIVNFFGATYFFDDWVPQIV
ncbi:MAG: hypothetical protein OXI83_19040, partial [Gemmatimonadota bacterium]|nr:hypothetical protein [Gemmatimonadota bacterium]